MGESDGVRWDERYAGDGDAPMPGLPERFHRFAELFASAGTALDVACGAGQAAVWLAMSGVEVLGVDISRVAIEQATALASARGVSSLCSFFAHDLDAGLPPGEPVDLVLCHLFRKPELYGPMLERLRPGGHLALAVLSEVGAAPGRFRAPAGELLDRFSSGTDALPTAELIDHHESDGVAWVLVRRT